jgi:hypothetical protein
MAHDQRGADHSTAQFTVDSVRVIARSSFDDSIYSDASVPELHLITCGGHFDRKTQEYTSNVVVFAHLVSAQPMPVIAPQNASAQNSAAPEPQAPQAPAVQAPVLRPKD